MELRRCTDRDKKYGQVMQVKVRRPIAVLFDSLAERLEISRTEALREAIFGLLKYEGFDVLERDVHPFHRRIWKKPAHNSRVPEEIHTILLQTGVTYDIEWRFNKAANGIGLTNTMVMRQAVYGYLRENGVSFERAYDDLPTYWNEG